MIKRFFVTWIYFSSNLSKLCRQLLYVFITYTRK